MTTTFDIAGSGFVVRTPRPDDAKACRMLLPGLAGAVQAAVAVDGARGLVVGAAAATSARRPRPLDGPGVMIHVIPPCRRHGIGRALYEAVAHLARQQGAQALYAAQRVEAGGDEMRCWQALGFSECEAVLEHELPLAPMTQRLSPLVARLRDLGRIPDDARIVPLYAADRAKVLQLHLDELGGDRGSLYQRLLSRGPGAFHPRYSRVLLLGGRVAGCILAHRKSRDVAAVDANIVIPDLRGDWANAWLKLEAALGAMSLGIANFHFTSFDQYDDTRAFSRKLGGATTRQWFLMMRPLHEAGG